jgi:hypothetical protein
MRRVAGVVKVSDARESWYERQMKRPGAVGAAGRATDWQEKNNEGVGQPQGLLRSSTWSRHTKRTLRCDCVSRRDVFRHCFLHD